MTTVMTPPEPDPTPTPAPTEQSVPLGPPGERMSPPRPPVVDIIGQSQAALAAWDAEENARIEAQIVEAEKQRAIEREQGMEAVRTGLLAELLGDQKWQHLASGRGWIVVQLVADGPDGELIFLLVRGPGAWSVRAVHPLTAKEVLAAVRAGDSEGRYDRETVWHASSQPVVNLVDLGRAVERFAKPRRTGIVSIGGLTVDRLAVATVNTPPRLGGGGAQMMRAQS